VILADAVAAPGAVAVPAGDPAELRAAASTLSASAEALDGAAATAEAVIGAAVPTAWAGTAARSCGDAQQRAVADCRALVRALREAAAAVAQLAAELEEAIRDARHVALQAADVAAAMLRINRMTLEVHAADLTELPAMQARARQLANEEAHLRALGAAAAERARLANLTAAAACDQVTATLPRIATLGAACPPATRTQLAALLGRPVAATTTPADQDTDSLLGLGAFPAGGVLANFAKKGKGRTGSRTGAGAVPGGGPSAGTPAENQARKQRTMPGAIWSAKEAEERALEMGYVKTTYLSIGQAVDRRGRRYISRDMTGYNGGAWKMADSPLGLLRRQTRMGTYDKALTQRVGN
jgi:uncharacterized protein YukE